MSLLPDSDRFWCHFKIGFWTFWHFIVSLWQAWWDVRVFLYHAPSNPFVLASVLQYSGTPITERDLRRLEPETFLNDILIGFGLRSASSVTACFTTSWSILQCVVGWLADIQLSSLQSNSCLQFVFLSEALLRGRVCCCHHHHLFTLITAQLTRWLCSSL